MGAQPANPMLLARKLERRRHWRQLAAAASRTRWLLLAAVAGIALMTLLFGQGWAWHVAMTVPRFLSDHPISLAVLSALLTMSQVLRGRRHAALEWSTSWLASAPVRDDEIQVALRWRVATQMAPLLVVAFAAMALCIASDAASHASGILAIVLGTVTGAVIGWRLGARPSRATPMAPPRLARSRVPTAWAPGTAALARWPFAQLRAAANPRLHAALVGGVLLSLPHSVPPRIAVSMLLLAGIALAAEGLLAALLNTLVEASEWLRTSPISRIRLHRALLGRAGGWQVAAAAVAGALLVVAGAAPQHALAMGAIWLAWCVSSVGTVLAWRSQVLPARLERIAIAACVLTIGMTSAYPLLALWPLWWIWQWRRGQRA